MNPFHRTPLQLAMMDQAQTRVRPLSQYEAAALGVATQSPKANRAVQAGVKGSPTTGEIVAPAYEVSGLFNLQSYFHDTLLEKAILAQPANQPIVPSTLSKPVMTAGYGLALTPSSQCPVGVQFYTGGMQGRSGVYRLKPGEVIFPFGRPGDENGQFSGFTWGLPFGWLGGGQATLVVLRTADARVTWGADHNELIYHRMRLKIVEASTLPVGAGAYNGSVNWPQRFPWPSAVSGTNALNQRGRPGLGVFPTRTALSLRMATVVGATMRMYFIGTNDFDTDSAGAATLTGVRAIDINWGTWAQQAGAAAPFTSAYQTLMLTGEAERFAADDGAVALAAPAASELVDQFVDVVRYGRL